MNNTDMNNVDLGKYKRIVQYFWDPEPRNDEDPHASIWCLGKEYVPHPATIPRHDGPKEASDNVIAISSPEAHIGTSEPVRSKDTSTHGWPEAFLDDFESKFWITYRSNFPIIPRSDDCDAASSVTLGVRLRSQLLDSQGFTSDTGWGCMIRSGQSLLANTLSMLMLGRDWRKGSKVSEETKLLSLFADCPVAPFSIHRFVKHGAESCNKYPGEWFGPSATARCIEALTARHESPALRVYFTNDTSDVFEDRFNTIARDDSGCIQPTLILLGTRLGIENVTPVYWDSLRAALQYPQSVGIAGGRPSASHYFVGVQGSYFFYLDPHHTRPAVLKHSNGEPYSEEELESYHTRRLRRLHIKDMDPSMLIGFLIKDESDWADWKNRVASTEGKPIVHILNGELQPTNVPGRKEALNEVEALDDDFEDCV